MSQSMLSLVCDVPTIATFLGTLVISSWLYIFWKNAHLNLPPCPWVTLPLLGNLLQLSRAPKRAYEHFYDLSKTDKYSKVFTVYFGCHRTIILNHIDVVQEALQKRQNDYASRPVLYSSELMTNGGKDILMGKFDSVWKLERRIGHTALRNYGMGASLERVVDEAMDIFLTEVQKEGTNNKPFNIKPHLFFLVVNMLTGMCFGKTYGVDDKELLEMCNITKDVLELLGNGLPADFLPVLQYLPKSSKEKKMFALLNKFCDFLLKHVLEHKQRRKTGYQEQNDLLDFLLHQIELEEKHAEGAEVVLTDEHIYLVIFDVFAAGIDTMVTSLHTFVGHMAMYPQVQHKIRKEIDSVIGDTNPRLVHRSKCPYTEACVKESMRKGTFAVLGIPLATTCNTQVAGYDVPKNTMVMVNIWAIHNDPDYWDKPDEFQPERFLDDEGKLAPKPQSFIPFSVGRRSCLGETLVKNALMLIVPKLLQRLEILPPEGKEFKLEMEEGSALAALPKVYDIIVKPRN